MFQVQVFHLPTQPVRYTGHTLKDIPCKANAAVIQVGFATAYNIGKISGKNDVLLRIDSNDYPWVSSHSGQRLRVDKKIQSPEVAETV
jgi:hypothetical protein